MQYKEADGMYQASSAFHNAVANNAPQKALLVFADAIFTNEDIDVDAGIEMDDYFNTETDIAIGQALSNEIRFSLFNDDRLLNNYEFGEFTAMVGVQTSAGTYSDNAYVIVFDGEVAWRGRNTTPYLTRNNSPVSSQPSWPVKSIAVYGTKVYAFGASGQCKVYTNGGAAVSDTINSFMQNKVRHWDGKGFNLNMDSRILKTYAGGKTETYEFVPWGRFIAKRPNVPDVNQIAFVCHDQMTKFDKDMPTTAELGISYPCTFSTLFMKLCQYAEVLYDTSDFINSTAVITEEPDEFENATMRQVMQWLAEAAASNLVFNRDGMLVFDWLHSTSLTLDEYNYIEYAPFWYETTRVDKLYNRSSESGRDLTVGTGNIGYLIQDNPLLKGVS